ncbi:ATP-binding protein [Spirochaeta dissipatitropha]
MSTQELNHDLFHKSPNAIAICRKDIRTSPAVFRFEEVNHSFASIFSSSPGNLNGRDVLDILPETCTENSFFESETESERYIAETGQWLRICLRKLNESQTAIFLHDISNQHTVAELLQDFFHTHTSKMDYQEIADRFRKVTGAQVAAFHVKGSCEYFSHTAAISAESEILEQLVTLTGTPLIHSRAALNGLLRMFDFRDIIEVESLAGLIGHRHPYYKLLSRVECTHLTGQKLVCLIRAADQYVGHFSLVMPPGERFSNLSLAEIFAREVGILLTRVTEDEAESNTLSELVKFSAQVPGGIFRLQRSRDGMYNFPFFTPHLTELLPVYLSEVSEDANSLFSFIRPDEERERFVAALEKSASRLHTLDFDFQAEHSQQRKRWLHVLAQPEKKSSGKIIWSGHISDVSERKEQEQALREAKQAAEDANKAKDQFIANVSHELRTPLNGIMGMTYLILKSPLNDEQLEYALLAQQSLQRMTNIVDDLLDFSRIANNTMRISSRSFTLSDTLQSMVQPYQLLAEQKAVELLHMIDPSVPASICGDPDRIAQIIGNLLNNAVKFTKEGSIMLMTDIEQTDGYEQIVFTVSDTGCGFDPALSDTLFEAFQQADGSLTRAYEGAGLGLTIARDLAMRMGGSISCSSTPGEGSTFRFMLPLEAGDCDQAGCRDEDNPHIAIMSDCLEYPDGEAVISQNDWNQLKILIAEDDRINRKIIQRAIESMGHEPVLAETGAEAIAALKQDKDINLILMDVQMPDMDGSEAVRRIRKGECGAAYTDIPVIAVTAHAHSDETEEFLKAGMNAVATKPVDLKKLEQTIQEFFR